MRVTYPKFVLTIVGLLLLIACNVMIYVWNPVLLQNIRNASFDQFQRLKPRGYQDVGVRVINIDDDSLREIGQWPWPRTRIAELVSKLAGSQPAAIALDIIFAESDRTSPQSVLKLWDLPDDKQHWLDQLPDHDQVLSDAVRHSRSVLGLALNFDKTHSVKPDVKVNFIEIGPSILPNLLDYTGGVLPLPILANAAAGIGSLSFMSDADGIIRTAPLIMRHQNKLVPSLISESLRLAQNTQNISIYNHQGSKNSLFEIGIGNLRIPVSETGEVWIHYTQPNPTRLIPAWRVLRNLVKSNELQGKILLIGVSAQGLMDMRFSPLGTIFPGIEVHAQVIEQILGGTTLIQPHWTGAADTVLILIGSLFVGLMTLSCNAVTAFLLFLTVVSLICLCAWEAYVEFNWLLDPVVPSMMISLVFLITSIVRHARSELKQRWIKRAFSRYVSPNLVDHLVNHPSELELGGRRKICSFVFTDLTDFTSLMESLQPEQAVSLLNEYLENMIAIAFSYQGTLDRIVGDAVAIVFSAPVEQPDHQRRAVLCALEMQKFANRYSQQILQQGVVFGQTRIGIHTGAVIVGNFGGKTIFDYRALGDPVNTAARLENANKHLATQVCVSENTLSGCPEIPSRPIARLLLKGKSNPLMVYEPLTSGTLSQHNLSEYKNAYTLMQAENQDATQAFKELMIRLPNDKLSILHYNRLKNGQKGDLIDLSYK